MKYRVYRVIAVAVVVIPLSSQVATPQKPSFEVSSVKPNKSGPNAGPMSSAGTRFVATNVTLRELVTYAYRQPEDQALQIIGAPNWANSDRFDIEGRAAGEERAIPQQQMRLMIQALLEDRFALKLHREARDVPVYILTGKEGPKFKLSEDQSPPVAPPPPPPQAGGIQTPFGVINPGRGGAPPALWRGMIQRVGSDTAGTAVPMTFFVSFLAEQLGRPVIDKTDLKGLVDFTLHWLPQPPAPFGGLGPVGPAITPPPATDSSGSIFTALQEIGLKLESTRGSVDVLVIDGVQKPSEN